MIPPKGINLGAGNVKAIIPNSTKERNNGGANEHSRTATYSWYRNRQEDGVL